jgi:hypothetical protein
LDYEPTATQHLQSAAVPVVTAARSFAVDALLNQGRMLHCNAPFVLLKQITAAPVALQITARFGLVVLAPCVKMLPVSP